MGQSGELVVHGSGQILNGAMTFTATAATGIKIPIGDNGLPVSNLKATVSINAARTHVTGSLVGEVAMKDSLFDLNADLAWSGDTSELTPSEPSKASSSPSSSAASAGNVNGQGGVTSTNSSAASSFAWDLTLTLKIDPAVGDQGLAAGDVTLATTGVDSSGESSASGGGVTPPPASPNSLGTRLRNLRFKDVTVSIHVPGTSADARKQPLTLSLSGDVTSLLDSGSANAGKAIAATLTVQHIQNRTTREWQWSYLVVANVSMAIRISDIDPDRKGINIDFARALIVVVPHNRDFVLPRTGVLRHLRPGVTVIVDLPVSVMAEKLPNMEMFKDHIAGAKEGKDDLEMGAWLNPKTKDIELDALLPPNMKVRGKRR